MALAQGDLAAAKQESAALSAAVAASGNPFQVRLGHEIAGRIALAEKKWAAAIAEFGAANQLNPLNRYHLSQAYAGQGDAAKAKALAESARHDNTLVDLESRPGALGDEGELKQAAPVPWRGPGPSARCAGRSTRCAGAGARSPGRRGRVRARRSRGRTASESRARCR